MGEEKKNIREQLESGTYEIIQNRLQKQKQELLKRLDQLNEARKTVFGAIDTKLIANERINTENNCIARDIMSLGNRCIFGYNVHFGLRTEIQLSDVFSIYEFKEGRFVPQSLDMIEDPVFITDFTNLYKYYRNTLFAKFAVVGNYLHMVFQLSESVTDIKTFKWLIRDNALQYVDNRSEHEFRFPDQHDFRWQEVTRDMHRYGTYSHISILDKVFVEAIGGDLTIKIEDNTDDGQGIFSEPVEYFDQTLDDAQYRFADLGNLIALEIKPFQEKPRYFVYNHKVREVKKIQSVGETAIQLPDEQGLIFPNGYYLQTGEYKIIDNDLEHVRFQQQIVSPNGEDHLFVFYGHMRGLYLLIPYNVIEQSIKTPIICNGFSLLQDGELCYFRSENEQTRHHVIQIWQTPFIRGDYMPSEHKDSLLYKIGNKDLVKAMAECHALINLLNKEDSYSGLYADISKLSGDVLDSYYWIPEEGTFRLDVPIAEIKGAADAALDEFEKVVQLRKTAANATEEVNNKAQELFGKVKSMSFRSIDDFVGVLSQLRSLRGEAITLKDVRYVDLSFIDTLEQEIAEQTDKISQLCVQFLLNKKALAPYHKRVEEKQKQVEKVKKVVDGKKLEEEVDQIAADLEMLIDVVSDLEIEDTSHSTQIIDNISLIFSSINSLKAGLKKKVRSLGSKEAKAEFAAQLKLVDQSTINYLDLSDTPEKCEEFLTKVSVQLEDLEGRFADFEDFVEDILEKREEVYASFEARKSALVEARNRRAIALQSAAQRILKGIEKKSLTFATMEEINGYFASDLMISKVRDIVTQLKELDDGGKAETLQTQLKVTKEDALRKLKDSQDLYEDGDRVIKLGTHRFGVNKQELDLTLVYKDDRLQYHLTGTDLYGVVDNEVLNASHKYWDQVLMSENPTVYRGSYLAYCIFTNYPTDILLNSTEEELLEIVRKESSERFSEGYVKGVHDLDAAKILRTLVLKHHDLGMLTFSPTLRAYAQYFWHGLEDAERKGFEEEFRFMGALLEVFPESEEYQELMGRLTLAITDFAERTHLFPPDLAASIAAYLFQQRQENGHFATSFIALESYGGFIHRLQQERAIQKFRSSYEGIIEIDNKIRRLRPWLLSYVKRSGDGSLLDYVDEMVCLELFPRESHPKVQTISPDETLQDLHGEHPTLKEGTFTFNYHRFVADLQEFTAVEVPAYEAFRKAKHQVVEQLKDQLKLETFLPRVLSSFVRNKLIDQVYLPIVGDNLAKQIGTIGDNKRTDRMGMLLLISPPGYGKTTLMEYVANRLGLVFMKINGPAIGHEVTSVDPMAANNAAARQELKKLNLSFEMGNNVMLYLDDIQHCNPEFLQKFISLADGTRAIEGVHQGMSKTYDLRGKKFCVVMAGNPYTESGEKFQIPDMLANRADIYNLGDIIGETADLFELSLIENSLTSNPILHALSSKYYEDVYAMIKMLETGTREGIELKGNFTPQEIEDYLAVLDKVRKIRDSVLRVNATYIRSAAMEDAYRTEPSFKLQGSYRDMNKMAAKVVPIMNDKEIQTLLLTHYESEAQTLTTAAEANLLKYKELEGTLSKEEKKRWASMKETFAKNNKLKGFGDENEMAQVLVQMMQFSENLEGIKKVLEKGLTHLR